MCVCVCVCVCVSVWICVCVRVGGCEFPCVRSSASRPVCRTREMEQEDNLNSMIEKHGHFDATGFEIGGMEF